MSENSNFKEGGTRLLTNLIRTDILEVPPDLRILWWGLHSGGSRRFAAATIEVRATNMDGAPAIVDVYPAAPARDVEEVLSTAAREIAHSMYGHTELIGVLQVVLALAHWDQEFRDSGLFPGNIYLASESSLPRLIACSGLPSSCLSGPLQVQSTLDGLFRNELIYRFPVALKFRAQYGRDRQFRLNCWGRRLARRIQIGDAGKRISKQIGECIRTHLDRHCDDYGRHVALLRDLDAHDMGAAWLSASSLPIGVLC
ncbi:hypothetical protein E0F15_21695 [Frankia sp. B2]|uniref:hypothetical protein n=1 Tax=Frankia sp. B2 TaxID=2541730 RepID=UPI00106D71CC|nr:hypothetical protein [Frankia sp. B2]TFE24466.1 hypothetical protein E0F15_21695 [Frankia sp. B2]